MTTSSPSPIPEHSLWFRPSGAVEQMLAGAIRDLSQEFSAPLFPPHVTLLGGLVGTEQFLLSRSQQVAQQLGPLRIELSSIAYLDEYFRALFLQVREADSVTRANQIARQVFGRLNDAPYMPHLSLLYGDFPSGTKKSIIERLGSHLSSSFEATRIYLYSTSGETSTWQQLGEFPLGHSGE